MTPFLSSFSVYCKLVLYDSCVFGTVKYRDLLVIFIFQPCSDMSLVMNPSFAKPNVFDFSNVNATGILDLDVAMHLAKTQFLPGLNGANSTASLASLTNVNPIVLNGNLENLTNLASSMTNATAILGVDPSSRTSLSPDMSDSGISVDAASTNSNNSATLINIAAMAKMGLSRQGELLVILS